MLYAGAALPSAMLCSDQFKLAAKGHGYTLQGRLGRVAGTALDTADVSLRNVGKLRELALRETLSHTGVTVLKAESDPHRQPLAQLRFAGRLSCFTLSYPVIKSGSHGGHP